MKESKAAEIAALVDALCEKDPSRGYAALQALLAESAEGDRAAAFLDRFFAMLDETSAYARMRAMTLIAANVRWDRKGVIEDKLDRLLSHVTDSKPIAARTCIQALSEVVAFKPQLAPVVARALLTADFSGYSDAMRPLLEKDARAACNKIAATGPSDRTFFAGSK